MGATILLNKKLQEAWVKDKVDKKSFNVKQNPNLCALKKKNIIDIEDYYTLLINKLNEKNSKYEIDRIEFVDEPIPYISVQALNAGMIVKRGEIENIPLAYVFISNPSLGSRNIFGAQQLFPGLSHLISRFILSPSYELTNLPVYFVNGSIDNVTESMQETITAMTLMGIRYVQIFDESQLPDGIFDSNLVKYSKFISNDLLKNQKDLIYTDFYKLDLNSKKITFITNTFKENNPDRFGSSDRFFVIKAYPALILADEERYDIDITNIQKFLSIYNKGRSNLEPFIKFAEKLESRERT